MTADPPSAAGALASTASSMSGRSGVPFRVVVEEGKVHEFARATKSTSVEHLRADDPIAPVTFLASAALWMLPENSAWFGVTRDAARRLHGEQEFVFHGPVPQARLELTARHSIGPVTAKQGRRGGTMTFTEMLTSFWTESEDRPLVEAKALSIETSRPPDETAGVDPAAPEPARPSPAAEPHGDEVAGLAAFTDTPLTVTDFVMYQGASGDFNPIHHDTEFAQASGFPGPFAVGMLPAGIAAAYLTAHFGAISVRRYKVRWQSQAWPGDALTYRAFQCADDDRFDVRVVVTRPDGSVHLQAWAQLDPSVARP